MTVRIHDKLYALIFRDRYRYSIQYQILILNLKMYLIEKVKYLIVSLRFEKNDLIATRTSPYKSSLLYFSEIYVTESAEFNQIKSLGGRQYR